MLPEVRLDTEHFEDMVSEMRNMISSIDPAWTDRNIHDPGMTFIDLFAWLQEIQQYQMDQISEKELVRYLGLLGEQRKKRAAARTVLVARGAQEENPATGEGNSGPEQAGLAGEPAPESGRFLRAGSRFFGGKFCFETETGFRMPGNRILFCGGEENGSVSFLDSRQLSEEGRMECYPFGKEARAGSRFYLGLSQAFPVGERERLSLFLYDEYPVKQNPVTEDFLPLGKIRYEYFGADGWTPLRVGEDKTAGFLKSGFLTFFCDGEMKETRVEGREAFWLRMTLLESGYEMAPVVTGLSFSHVEAVQKRTRALAVDRPADKTREGYLVRTGHALAETGLAEGYLKFGDGYRKAVRMEKKETEGETSFYLQWDGVEEPDGARVLLFEKAFEEGRRLPDGDGFPFQQVSFHDGELLSGAFELMGEDDGEPGVFCLWSRVEDFHCSGPESRHYILDEERGRLLFGDGFHGLSPEGRLLISGYADSFGEEGNINRAAFRSEDGTVRAESLKNAEEGQNPESFSDAFYRFLASLKEKSLAVSLSDYENLTMKTPGLRLFSCRAMAVGENAVRLAVMPYQKEGAGLLSPACAKNIRRHLEKYRMVGTSIQVGPPEYIFVSVTAELSIRPQYRDGGRMARERIREFFEARKERMGEPLKYRQLYAMLDGLDFVEEIRFLTLEARGNRFVRSGSGDVIPPPDGVFLLKELECITAV